MSKHTKTMVVVGIVGVAAYLLYRNYKAKKAALATGDTANFTGENGFFSAAGPQVVLKTR